MAAEETKTVIVDGSNVAHSSEGEKAALENIRIIRDKLIEEGYEPVVLADAALRHQIAAPAEATTRSRNPRRDCSTHPTLSDASDRTGSR